MKKWLNLALVFLLLPVATAFGQQPMAVNHVRLLSAATGSNPALQVYGVDTNIGLAINLKGTGQITGTFSVNAIPSSQTAATTTSFQAIAGDATFGAAWGSSTAASPVYGGGVMGNAISTANMTATKNILFGVWGKADLSGTNSSTYPLVGVGGEIGGDPVTTAVNAAVMAVMGGDAGTTTAPALYGVDWMNSTPTTRVNFGLDLQGGGTHDSYLAPRYNQAHIRLGGRSLDSNESTVFTANNICIVVVNSAPVDGVSGTRAGTCGPGSLLIRADNGTLFQNTNTLASPTWTAR